MSFVRRWIGIALTAGILAGCGGTGTNLTPTLTQRDLLRHDAATSVDDTPEGHGLGNQKWTNCGTKSHDHEDNEHEDGSEHERSSRDEDRDDSHHHHTSAACSSIDLIAPVNAAVDTSVMSPGSSTASATLKFSAATTATCSPYSISGTAPAPFAFPLNATPFSTSMEVSTRLTGLTVNDPCPIVTPTGAGTLPVVGAAPAGYYIVLVSTNATGNMAMTGAMTLASVNGTQLTFAPLPDALIDLPSGFSYAFYLAHVNVAGAISLPLTVHGGV